MKSARAEGDKYGAVKIETVKNAVGSKRMSTANPQHKDNVNVAQGPRTGNRAARDGKRATFIADKEDAAPLAKVIQDAYARRQHEYQDYEYTNGGSIHDNTNVQVRSKGRK